MSCVYLVIFSCIVGLLCGLGIGYVMGINRQDDKWIEHGYALKPRRKWKK